MFWSLTIVNLKRESPVVKSFTPVTFYYFLYKQEKNGGFSLY